MITVLVTYRCKRGQREAFYQALCDIGARKRSYDEGCIMYDYHFAAEDPDVLFLLEKWPDQEVLTAHLQTEAFARMQPLKEQYCEDVTLERFEGER